MQRYILMLLASFIITALFAPRFLKFLKKLNFGQTIYELGPQTHLSKQGTPTMGGLLFVGIVTALIILLHGKPWLGKTDFIWPMLFITLGNALVGFIDDYIKVFKKRSEGLRAREKLFGQLIIAILFSIYCYKHPHIGTKVNLLFTTEKWDLGRLYVPIMSLLVIFMTNSANLQDGIDGILSSVTAIGAGSLAFIAALSAARLVAEEMKVFESSNIAIISLYGFGLVGACLGFLRVNYFPAKMFMGDTGSMFIGGAMVGMAILLQEPFLLLLCAFPLIASSISVIMQTLYFKITKGKRIFKMSPLHHHFELLKFKEVQIVAIYSVFTALLSMIAMISKIAK